MVVVATICGWMPTRGQAASVESLLMPGKVSAAHAKIEDECSQCHDRADRSKQSQLCLGCHKAVAEDVRTGRGLHGRRSNAASTTCNACHSEHLGRDGKIVNLLPQQFNHRQTDFTLDGAHARIACGSCHLPGKKYSEAADRCVDCHSKQEPHEQKLGADCAACHQASRWSAIRFDHASTKFALQDKHSQIPCAACHMGNRWKDTPMQCVSCHAPDDVHRSQRGIKCGDCHTTKAWNSAKFDHARETGFALLGAHSRADCQSCHVTGRFEDKLPRECSGCHASTDSHSGRLGSKCETCHEAQAWKPATFDHERDAHMALQGVHARLACHDCHTANVATQKLQQDCSACHRADDVHAGRLGTDCASCHEQEGWKKDLHFDHDLTDFPLIGQHVPVPCAQCHTTRKYKDVATDCKACHQADDVHKGGLGDGCATCHNPNDWRQWEFDHLKQSGFGLTGAHAKLQCASCHRQPAGQVKIGSDCGSCHARDDIHLGQFGRQCSRCHSTISFRSARPQ